MIDDITASMRSYFSPEAAAGILLLICTVLAMLFANTPLVTFYDMLLSVPVEIRVGALQIDKPLLLWINDGLMAVFFFVVGLELKREVIEGELSDRKNILLPGIGAIGGMAIPALVYYFFNRNDPVALQGWAIPAATDIAFALGILGLLGSRVPVSVKIFLTSLAIFDDIGAIIIIAVFYTSKISFAALFVCLCCLPLLAVLNLRNVSSRLPYILVGLVMWVATLKSGVHATLAGVVTAMFIPMYCSKRTNYSPLKSLEHDLHSMVMFFILPLFAFANAGISLAGMGLGQILHGVPVGVALGLFVGKQVGIFLICWAAIKILRMNLPNGMTWMHLYGASVLCGVGFTMSLFIGSLAFEETGAKFDDRVGIILGSFFSGIWGYIVLKHAIRGKPKTPEDKTLFQPYDNH